MQQSMIIMIIIIRVHEWGRERQKEKGRESLKQGPHSAWNPTWGSIP